MKYLYNGVPFEQLPEWEHVTADGTVVNKETFPYCIIYWDGVLERYEFMFFDRPVFYTDDTDLWGTDLTYCVKNVVVEEYTGDFFGFGYQVTATGEWYENLSYRIYSHGGACAVIYPGQGDKLIWSSHDILDDNGDVHFPGSDPVPVTQLNPAALMQSFFVGEAVKRCRR